MEMEAEEEAREVRGGGGASLTPALKATRFQNLIVKRTTQCFQLSAFNLKPSCFSLRHCKLDPGLRKQTGFQNLIVKREHNSAFDLKPGFV